MTRSAERSATAPSGQPNQAGRISRAASPTRRAPRVRQHSARATLGLTIGVAAAIAVGTMSAFLGSGRLAVVSASAAAARLAQPASHGALVASRLPKLGASASAPISVQPHIMMIVEENQSASSIIGNTTDAPYLNALANTYARASQWYAVQHNSPHDYLDLLVGSDLGLPNGQPYSTPTLVDELHSASIPWKAYMESMPSTSTCYTGGTTSDGLYDPIHNPFHYFTNYKSSSGWCSSANQSTEGIVPYTGSSNLVSTLDGSNPPDYVYIVPNDCNNMHGDTTSTTSPCLNDTKSQLRAAGDSWVSTNLAPVLNSNWFKQDGIVIITWDEGTDNTTCCNLGTSAGGHIATIVVAAGNKGRGIYSTAGDHYGTLRATEDAYGVAQLGGSKNSVNGDLTPAFGSPTGVIAGTVSDTENPAQPVSAATVSYTGVHGSGSTSTNSSGAYTLAGITAGTYTVSVTDTGFTAPATQNVTVTSSATSTANFTMTANSGIGGTLANSDGSALAGVKVTYTGISGSTGGGSVTTSSSPYAFTGVPPGSYKVSASETGFTSPPTQNVTVSANGTATANFVMAAAALGSISGTVTNGTTGLLGATVKYTGPTGSGQTNTSDSNGDYQLSGVADGTYSVTASDATYQPETFTVSVSGTATTTQSFVLTSGTNGSIAGTVTDAQTSQPISGVVVKATSTSYTATTDASGNYVIENVAPASYSLTFAATNYVTGSAGVTVATSANTEQNAALTETGTISGKVTDASTHVAIVGATLSCASCPVTSVPTDSSGNYSFTQVAPGGGYTISVTATGYTGQTSGSLTVNPGATTTQNFQLARPVSVSVHETFGAANTGASGTTTMTAVPDTPTGAGDLLVATIKLRASSGTATVTSVTDSAGNVWTKGPAVGSVNDEEIWYVAGSASVSSTQTNPGVIVTTSAAAAIAFTVLDVAGASVLDQTKTNSGTAAPPQPSVGPTNTTIHGTEIVIAAIGWNSTPTLSGQTTGYALQTVQQSTVTSLKTAEQAAWLILSAPGAPSYGATMSATAAWTAAIATFG